MILINDRIRAPLAGRTMVITGASSGIGRGIALAAARAGADLALTYRSNEAGVRRTAADIESMGRRVVVSRMDLADAASIQALARDVSDAFPRIDAWVNNAGADIVTAGGDALLARRQARPAVARRSARNDDRVVGRG